MAPPPPPGHCGSLPVLRPLPPSPHPGRGRTSGPVFYLLHPTPLPSRGGGSWGSAPHALRALVGVGGHNTLSPPPSWGPVEGDSTIAPVQMGKLRHGAEPHRGVSPQAGPPLPPRGAHGGRDQHLKRHFGICTEEGVERGTPFPGVLHWGWEGGIPHSGDGVSQILMKRMAVTRAKPARSRMTLGMRCWGTPSSWGKISKKVI